MERKRSEHLYLSCISVATVVSYDLWNVCLTRYVNVLSSGFDKLAVSFVSGYFVVSRLASSFDT